MRVIPLLCLAAACGGAKPGGPLRLGYFPNVTHAQALVGGADGTFAREIPAGVELRAFHAGPEAAEALLAGSLDASYIGGGPALIAFVRSGGDVVVIAGAASGGSVLVGRGTWPAPGSPTARVASPQIGNTQDIALRTWLETSGTPARVFPLANADIASLFGRGTLDAAWVPEPWAARLLAQGAHLILDERELWPRGRCPTTVLVARRRVLRSRSADVLGLLRAHVALTERWRARTADFEASANEAFARYAGKPLAAPILRDAFSRIDPAVDPMADELSLEAEHARALGYLPSGDVAGVVDSTFLDQVVGRTPDGSD